MILTQMATIDLGTVDLNTLIAGRQTTFTVAGQGSYTVDNSGCSYFYSGCKLQRDSYHP